MTHRFVMLAAVLAGDAGRTCDVVQDLQAKGKGLIASVAVGRAEPSMALPEAETGGVR